MKPNFSSNFKSEHVDKELIKHIQSISRDLYNFMNGFMDLNNLPIQIINSLVYVGEQRLSFSWQDSNRKRKIIGIIPIMTGGAILSNISSQIINNGIEINFTSNLQIHANFLIIGE